MTAGVMRALIRMRSNAYYIVGLMLWEGWKEREDSG